MSYPRHGSLISVFGLRPSFGARVSGFGFRSLLAILVVALASHPGRLWACAACTGQSDSPMAKGMNWGIMSLLVVIALVLGGVASFFVFLAKKSAAVSAAAAQANPGRASVPASPDSHTLPEKLGLAGTLALPNRADSLFGSTNAV